MYLLDTNICIAILKNQENALYNFSLKYKVTKLNLPVMSSWLEDNQQRLDASPFLSGAFEARVILNRLKTKKEPLQKLTKGHKGRIFNSPRFPCTYVNDPNYGVPFLGSTDILRSEGYIFIYPISIY